MEPLIHPSNNIVFRAPEEFGTCQALPATQTVVNGAQATITFWKPSPDELASLQEGSSVMLVMYSPIVPMHWVTTGKASEINLES